MSSFTIFDTESIFLRLGDLRLSDTEYTFKRTIEVGVFL